MINVVAENQSFKPSFKYHALKYSQFKGLTPEIPRWRIGIRQRSGLSEAEILVDKLTSKAELNKLVLFSGLKVALKGLRKNAIWKKISSI